MFTEDSDVSIMQLRCFVVVVEAGSIAEAARRLGIAPPSVSRAIARLEKGAGVRLLHRSTHALSLTEEGEALLQPARDTVEAAQTFREVSAGRADMSGSGVVRVTAPVGFARQVLCPLLSEFAALHPAIYLDVRVANEIVDLADNGVDLALRAGSLSRVPGHLQQFWFDFPWVICASPSYLAGRAAPIEPDDLDRHDRIGFRNLRTGQVQGWPMRSPTTGMSIRYTSETRFAFDDGDAVWQAILAGAGIGCAPLWLAAGSLRSGQAIEVLRDWRDNRTGMTMLRRDRRLTPTRVSLLQTFLLEHSPYLADLI